jgi:hypothetical protein
MIYTTVSRQAWPKNVMGCKERNHKDRRSAYCLMGLFNVTMPILYGEGDRAFLRLQQEIIRSTEDHSIFAWVSDQYGSRLPASSPSSFLESGTVVGLRGRELSKKLPASPHSMSSRVSNIEMNLLESEVLGLSGFIALLNCCHRTEPGTCLAVYLINIRGEDPNIFCRA